MANGLYSNSEIVDSLIADLNTVIKEIVSGQYLQACCYITGMVQKMTNLRRTIDNDLKNRDETIEQLKRELRSAGREVVDVAPEKLIKKDGAENGIN